MKIKEGGGMDIQDDKDFAALPEVAKLYQACKERDLTIAEREYLKGARDAWQAKAQAVPEGFVLVPKHPNLKILKAMSAEMIKPNNGRIFIGKVYKAMLEAAQEPAND